MICVQNKTDNTRSRLGVALYSNTLQKPEKTEQAKTATEVNKVFQEEKQTQPIIKINRTKEIDKEKENQINEKFIHSGNNIFSLNKKQSSSLKKNKKNYVVKLKNNMLFPINVPGCTPYDPYLINVCKNAIIEVKDELPNYKEIIKKINTEFGIEEGNNLIELSSENIGFNTFNSFKSLSKTKTNFTREKNASKIEMNTISSFNKDNENKNNNNTETKEIRKQSRKK